MQSNLRPKKRIPVVMLGRMKGALSELRSREDESVLSGIEAPQLANTWDVERKHSLVGIRLGKWPSQSGTSDFIGFEYEFFRDLEKLILWRHFLLFKDYGYKYHGFKKKREEEKICLVCASFKWKYICIFASKKTVVTSMSQYIAIACQDLFFFWI